MIRRLLSFALVALFVISGIVTGYKLMQYRSADKENQEARENIVAEPPQSSRPEPEIPGPQPEADSLADDPLADDPYAAALRDIDFPALQETNEEVIGWILIPDTQINYPLLQTTDNEYYLTHTWKKQYNAGGSVFMEQFCAGDMSDFNTIIYGHRMIDLSMFGSLKYYKDDSYRQEHPAVYIATPERIFRYEVFAAHEPGITELTYRLGITDDKMKQAFLDFTLSRTVIDTGIVPTTEDRILTLSTCTGHGHDTRWVVQARLTHEAAMEAEQGTPS